MSWVEAIHASAYAAEIRDSTVIYPLLQVVHIIGFALLAGSLIVAYGRMLGVGRSVVAFDDLLDLMRPVMLLSAVAVLLTGSHMAIGFIDVFAVNPVMWAKLAILAVLVAIALPLVVLRKGAAVSPLHRALAAASLIGWPTLIVLGKLLAYIGGKD